jgi:hypothetical protein
LFLLNVSTGGRTNFILLMTPHLARTSGSNGHSVLPVVAYLIVFEDAINNIRKCRVISDSPSRNCTTFSSGSRMLSVQLHESLDSSVGRATGYVVNARSWDITLCSKVSRRVRDSPSHLRYGYKGPLPQSYTCRGRDADLHVLPWSRSVELYLHSPIRHGVLLP